MWRTLDTIIMDEMATFEILRELAKGPAAVKDIAGELSLPPPQVLRYILALQRRGIVALADVNGGSPRYQIAEEAASYAA
jgi:DNA-binding IclR family transcriptional regulator